MNKKTVVAASLILGISASSVFAESNTVNNEKQGDSFAQSQENALGLRANSMDWLINTRNLIENAKSRKNENSKDSKFIPKRIPRNSRNTPKLRENEPNSKSNRPKKPFTVKVNTKNKKGDTDPNKLSENETVTSRNSKRENTNEKRLSKRNTRLYKLIYNGRNLEQLTPLQRAKVLEMHKRILKTQDAQVLLRTIQKGEGGGLLVIVGKGQGKSRLFKQKMRNLNTNTHPAYQFPKGMRCFFHSKYGCSTAAGFYQITKTNFDKMVKYLGIKDFSEESQQIMALELIRTGKAKIVRGNYKGRGYVELMKGNVDNAVRYGTNDWASSRFSEWGGKKADYLGDSRQIAREMNKKNSKQLKDQQYFQSWLDEVERADAS